MPRFLTTLLIIVSLSFNINAQYDYFSYDNGKFNVGMDVYVFSEEVALKANPFTTAEDVTILQHGERLKILQSLENRIERNGVLQNWYQVVLEDNEEIFYGYISGHDLALGAVTFIMDYKRDLLLFQITGYQRNEAYTMTAKIVRDGKVLREIEVPFIDFPNNPAYPDYSVAVLKNIQTGIDRRSEVAEITFFHTNTKFPAGTLYLIWNGENLDDICETMYIKEPGIFEYDSYLVYPGREGVEQGTVMLVEIIREYDEESNNYVEVKRIRTTYVWDGKKITVAE